MPPPVVVVVVVTFDLLSTSWGLCGGRDGSRVCTVTLVTGWRHATDDIVLTVARFFPLLSFSS